MWCGVAVGGGAMEWCRFVSVPQGDGGVHGVVK